MPNMHDNSKLMRVQNSTYEKIRQVAFENRIAMNAQLAVIVDEWCATNGIVVDVDRVVRPARKNTPAPAPRRRT